ncbi:MAG: DUF5668 domain-containing protein [Candidatus Margulisiibacteriota bacterium]
MSHHEECCSGDHGCCSSKCSCLCHKTLAVLVILFGAVFLLGHAHVISQHAVDLAWPALIVLAGLKMIFSGICKCCKKKEDA